MKWLPTGLSLLRAALAPVVLASLLDYRLERALTLVIFAALTDVIDGQLARRYGWVTRFGAYLDITADFLLLGATYLALTFMGVTPPWLMLLIVSMFGQFMLSALRGKLRYDPIGKYYGTVLYASGIAIFVLQEAVIAALVAMLILIMTMVSLSYRWVWMRCRTRLSYWR